MLQRCRSARKVMAILSVPTRTVFRRAGNVMVMLTVLMDQMKLAVVSYPPAVAVPTTWGGDWAHCSRPQSQKNVGTVALFDFL